MAPGCQQQGALHAADAAADHRNVLGLVGLDDAVLLALHGLGGQGTAGHMDRVHQVLVVGRALIAGHGEAGVVAADTGA